MTKKIKNVMPRHVGIIPDGNRRWAKKNKRKFIFAYDGGVSNLIDAMRSLFESGVEYVTFYAFSLKNFQRSAIEKKLIFSLIRDNFPRFESLADELELRVVFSGRLEKFPKDLQDEFFRLAEKTRGRKKTVISLTGYDGLDELEYAAEKAKNQGGTLRENLFIPEFVPPIDLLIRTSGERRISGFAPYLTTYSELYFSDKLWPDFSKEDIKNVLEWYASRERRFGK